MKNRYASILYLSAFVTSSTACMGFFAAIYGEATRRLGDLSGSLEFTVTIASCGMSLVVGIIWVTLSLMGRLEKIFS
jgi:hypothetical protein